MDGPRYVIGRQPAESVSSDVIGARQYNFGAQLLSAMEDMDMMEVTRYAIVQWEDKLTSVISLHNIKLPRKSVTEYIEGEYVTALYGKKQYRARISEINGKFDGVF
ncbi:MAG: hypothetical protein ABW185_28925 [Sedimenticola sp.]